MLWRRRLFSLERDQISEIISWEGKFYIQKCISAYDEEATAARKLRLLEEKKPEPLTRFIRRLFRTIRSA